MSVLALSVPFTQPFLASAALAGTFAAAACGLIGYFLVLRAQVFTGDALSHVAVTGAFGALAFGIDPRIGVFTAAIAVSVMLGILGDRGRVDDVVVGSLFAWILGLGVLFLSIYTTGRSINGGSAGAVVLFGSIFGLTTGQAVTTALVGAAVCVAMMIIARPLLFATVDPLTARANGVPVRFLGYGFLALVAIAAAETTQAIGGLLVLGLLAAPAGTAYCLTNAPYRAMALSVALAVGEMWGGLTLSYVMPTIPPSTAIIALSTIGYTLAVVVRARRRRKRHLPVA